MPTDLPADMPTEYRTIITNVGLQKIRDAMVRGEAPLRLKTLVVSDSDEELSEETTRIEGRTISVAASVKPDPNNENTVIISGTIPYDQPAATEEAIWVKQVGIYDDDPTGANLIIVSEYPTTYKPPEGGSTKVDLDIEIRAVVARTDALVLTISKDDFVTKEDLAQHLEETVLQGDKDLDFTPHWSEDDIIDAIAKEPRNLNGHVLSLNFHSATNDDGSIAHIYHFHNTLSINGFHGGKVRIQGFHHDGGKVELSFDSGQLYLYRTDTMELYDISIKASNSSAVDAWGCGRLNVILCDIHNDATADKPSALYIYDGKVSIYQSTFSATDYGIDALDCVFSELSNMENGSIKPKYGVHLRRSSLLQMTENNLEGEIENVLYIPPWDAEPIGTIKMYAGEDCPNGWLFCNGQSCSRLHRKHLFNVIGETYGGGNGSTTFNVPDFRGRMPLGAGQGVGLTNRVIGVENDDDGGGFETHTLIIDEMPRHSHNYTPATKMKSGRGGGRDKNFADVGAETASDWVGSDAPHNNMPPYVVTNFIIKY